VVHGQINLYGPRGPLGSGLVGSPSVVSESSGANNSADWETRVHIARQAPPDARFARMVVTVEDALLGEQHHFDEAQFEEASEPSDYEPARKVMAHACGARSNRVVNPSFEVNALGWSVSNSALTIETGDSRFGNNSLELQPLLAGLVTASTTVDIDPERFYTFSMYVKPVDDDVPITMAVEWLDADDNVLRSFGRDDDIVSDGNWRRGFVTDVGPPGAVRAVFSVLAYLDLTERLRLDAALVETGNVVQDYFDGSFAGIDYDWSGAAHASTSIYIENRDVYESVLGRYLDEYVPASTPWEIVYTA
jgi:hypothetical protein